MSSVVLRNTTKVSAAGTKCINTSWNRRKMKGPRRKCWEDQVKLHVECHIAFGHQGILWKSSERLWILEKTTYTYWFLLTISVYMWTLQSQPRNDLIPASEMKHMGNFPSLASLSLWDSTSWCRQLEFARFHSRVTPIVWTHHILPVPHFTANGRFPIW